MSESNRAKYKEMNPGDLVIFSEKNSGKFQYCGKVTAKVENEKLGNHLWPACVPTKHWKLIYFLEDIRGIHIDKTKLVVTLGYDKKFVVPGVTRLNQVARDTILSKHGSMEAFVDSFPT